MDIASLVIAFLLRRKGLPDLGGMAAQAAARAEMAGDLDAVVRRVRRAHDDLSTVPAALYEAITHQALYWLWKAVTHSGDVADFARDTQEEKVLALVRARIADGRLAAPPTVEAFVAAVMDSALELTF